MEETAKSAHRIGFLVNPIAGMGGRVGLKGTDGVVDEAVALGAEPMAHLKAVETLRELRKLLERTPADITLRWLTCSDGMGADSLEAADFTMVEIAFDAGRQTSDRDTIAAVTRFLERGVDLILFCGGDGTARDVCSVTGTDTPILGIPSGVKMFSGVFGTNPAKTAEILVGFLEGRLTLADVDILDLDEERYRRGEWAVRLYYSALTPYEPSYTQAAKMLITEASDADVKKEIADYLSEEIDGRPETLFLLGAGSTIQSVGEALNVDKTLLGVDAVAGGRLIGKDLNERQLLDLLKCYPKSSLILSPIGAQGFVLGRGNLQLSPEVVRRVGIKNLIIVATPAKMARTPVLRFDTGDGALDAELVAAGYLPVVIGYRARRLVKVSV
jgi:predicted polyphosphate/ATP-dependent NAD kinase